MGSDTNAPQHEAAPENAITELCRILWSQGDMPGTSGAMSLQQGTKIWMTPSGVQKEQIESDDLLVWDAVSSDWSYKPRYLKSSASTPLFLFLHEIANAKAVIHTHSISAVIASALEPSKEFCISHIENIKAIPKGASAGNLAWSDTLRIPIIENQDSEELLEPEMRMAIAANPTISAILVRRHGLYVWGESVAKAKIINEAIEHILKVAIEMQKLGIPRLPAS